MRLLPALVVGAAAAFFWAGCTAEPTTTPPPDNDPDAMSVESIEVSCGPALDNPQASAFRFETTVKHLQSALDVATVYIQVRDGATAVLLYEEGLEPLRQVDANRFSFYREESEAPTTMDCSTCTELNYKILAEDEYGDDVERAFVVDKCGSYIPV